MYSPLRSESVQDTLRDIAYYKKRIKYIEKIYEYYKERKKSYSLENSSDDFRYKIFEKQIQSISVCGGIARFAVSDKDHTKGVLVNGSFCRQRICPLCQRRRSLRLYSNVMQILQPIKNNYSFLHLSLTVPNCEVSDISDTITNINNASKELFKKLKHIFKGVIRSLEVTYNFETETMHPHLHCLILVNKSYFTSRNYIKYEDLKKMWGEITNNKNPQIYIRKCTELENCVKEVVKYASKPIDFLYQLTEQQALDCYSSVAYALKNRRLIQCFGVCAELSKKFHLNLDDDIEQPTEYEIKHSYLFNENVMEFFPAPFIDREYEEQEYKKQITKGDLTV